MNAPVSKQLPSAESIPKYMKKEAHLIRDRNLLVLFCVTLIVVQGVTSIAPAFPMISQALGVSKKQVGLLITVFTLPGIFLSPVLGVLSDRTGRKKMLVPSLFLFGISGTACAFTGNFTMLLVLRFVQGLGAAALGSLNLTIIGDIYSGEKRIRALGYNSTVLSLGAAVYPALGGAMALLGWQFPFLLSITAIPVGIAVLRILKNPEPQGGEHILAYLKNTISGMKDPRIYLLFFGTLATFILLYGVLFSFFPFYLYERFNAGSFSTGILISSVSIGTVIGSWNIGALSRRFTSRRLIMASFVLYAVAIVATKAIPFYAVLGLPMFIYGFANGINIPGTQTLLAERIPMEYRGAYMSVNSMILRAGQTAGPLFMAAAMTMGNDFIFYGAALFSILVFGVLKIGLRD
jgi:MFS transporter, ACDE family, multidrug resistance protein